MDRVISIRLMMSRQMAVDAATQSFAPHCVHMNVEKWIPFSIWPSPVTPLRYLMHIMFIRRQSALKIYMTKKKTDMTRHSAKSRLKSPFFPSIHSGFLSRLDRFALMQTWISNQLTKSVEKISVYDFFFSLFVFSSHLISSDVRRQRLASACVCVFINNLWNSVFFSFFVVFRPTMRW